MVLHKLKTKIGIAETSGASNASEGVDEIDSENQSILMGIISQLRPGCDLSRITLPTFILEKKSMLERITNAFFTPDILLEANEAKDEVQRFLLIVKWYLSGWHIAPKAVKKPLNPVLGEFFTCYWDELSDGSSAYYIAEQTSHHPPESSYFYLVPERRIRGDGVLIPKSKFLGNSSAAMMEGIASLTLGEHDSEVYTVTQPNIYCRGILFGKLRYELGDSITINCESTGLRASIDFKTKGFISGEYDAIEGTIKRGNNTISRISGKWNGVMDITDEATGSKSTFLDTSKSKLAAPKVKPLEHQLSNESRKLWHSTLIALENNDHETATNEKFAVEDRQRQEAKERTEKGEVFLPTFFVKTSEKEIPYLVNIDIDLENEDPQQMVSKLMKLHQIVPEGGD